MPTCSVYGCNSTNRTRNREKEIHFHRFPNRSKSPRRFSSWVQFCKRKNFSPGKAATVCSVHFKNTDYDETQLLKMKLMPTEKLQCPKLKPGSVPSICPALTDGDTSHAGTLIHTEVASQNTVWEHSSQTKMSRTERYETKRRREFVDTVLNESDNEKDVHDVQNDMSENILPDRHESSVDIQCKLGSEIARKYLDVATSGPALNSDVMVEHLNDSFCEPDESDDSESYICDTDNKHTLDDVHNTVMASSEIALKDEYEGEMEQDMFSREDKTSDLIVEHQSVINPMVNCSKEVNSMSEVIHFVEPAIKKETIYLENESLDADVEMETAGMNFIVLHLQDGQMSTSALNVVGDPAENHETEGSDPLEGADPLVSPVDRVPRFSCEHCDEVFIVEAELKEHRAMVHKIRRAPQKRIKGVYPCPHCDRFFPYPSKLNEHIVSHTHEKKFSCDICWRGFSRLGDMYKHRSIHAGSTAKKRARELKGEYWCFECNKVFQWPSKLKEHLPKHVTKIHTTKKKLDTSSGATSTSEAISTSKAISTSTSKKTAVPMVETKEESGDYPLVSYIGYEGRCFCRHCDEVLAGETELKEHLVRAHRNKIAPLKRIRGIYPCPHCDKSFWFPSKLNEHLVCHIGEKKYVCDICHRGFTRNGDMYKHRSRHVGSNASKRVRELKGEYRCFQCDTVFQWQSELQGHLQTHVSKKEKNNKINKKKMKKKPYTRKRYKQTFNGRHS